MGEFATTISWDSRWMSTQPLGLELGQCGRTAAGGDERREKPGDADLLGGKC